MKFCLILILLFGLSNCGKIGPLMTDQEYALKIAKKNQQ